MKAFYHLNSVPITIKEYMFGTPWLLLPVVLFIKLFRIPINGSTDDPVVETVAPFEVAEAELPADVREKFQPLAGELSVLGFGSPIYHVIADPLRSTQLYWATFLHSSGSHIARIHCRVWTGAPKVKTFLFPIFCTPFSGGTFVVSSAGKPDMLSPKSVQAYYHVGVSVQKLWTLHESAVQKISVPPSVMATQDELRQTVEEWHRQVRDFHIARGVFQPLKEDEVRRLALINELSEREDVSSEDAFVFGNILSIQQKKSSTASVLALLVISLLVFIIAGRFSRFSGIMMIIPILALHELGHYATMRAFNYRNVNMFFIPLLGAAVSGQHYNVPGWKRAIVALSGPVPGIFIGVFLGIFAAVLKMDALLSLTLMMVAINAFNLLPIIPLDGGWVFHAVLFSRHPYLDTAFRALAVLGLFVLGIAIQATVLAFFAIFMAMALPNSWHQADIAHRLRKRGLSGESSDSSTIPIETAGTILQEVRATQPKLQTPSLLAQQVLGIFQTLNTRPPGFWASISLLFVYACTMAFALIAGAILYVASRGLGNGY